MCSCTDELSIWQITLPSRDAVPQAPGVPPLAYLGHCSRAEKTAKTVFTRWGGPLEAAGRASKFDMVAVKDGKQGKQKKSR